MTVVGCEAFKLVLHDDKKTGRRRPEFSPTVSYRLILSCMRGERLGAITTNASTRSNLPWEHGSDAIRSGPLTLIGRYGWIYGG